MQEILHELKTVGFENHLHIDRSPQQPGIQQLANAALHCRQNKAFTGKIAKFDLRPPGKPVIRRHHAVNLLTQRGGDMNMRGPDRCEDQRDVGVQRESGVMGDFVITGLITGRKISVCTAILHVF